MSETVSKHLCIYSVVVVVSSQPQRLLIDCKQPTKPTNKQTSDTKETFHPLTEGRKKLDVHLSVTQVIHDQTCNCNCIAQRGKPANRTHYLYIQKGWLGS